MRVVMLSQDKNVLKPSAVQARMASYGTIFDEVSLVVFGAGKREEAVIAQNVRAVFPGGSNKISAFLNGAKETLRSAQKIRADVISAQDPFFIGLAGLWVARRLNIPLQVQLHTDCFSSGFRNASLRRMLETIIARFVLKRASSVRVVSERAARTLDGITRAPVAVLPIALKEPKPISNLVPKEFRGNFTVLAVARLAPEKQLHLLIDAMKLLPSADLVIVGDGPLRESLERRAKSLELQARVRFAGWQSNLAPYYEHASALASVSRYEGYGMALAEAALYALPIVATDAGLAGDLLENEKECLIVHPRTRDIADALNRLKENPDFARELGRRAKLKMGEHVLDEKTYLARYKEAMHTCA